MSELEIDNEQKNDLSENLKNIGPYSQWENHINETIKENFVDAVKNYNSEEQDIGIEVKDMISIDRIEEDIVVGELLDGNMVEILVSNFGYDIAEGDIINVNLTYEKGEITNIEVLDKNEEEKQTRLKLMQETLRRIRKKD